jgi:hypothetical protein
MVVREVSRTVIVVLSRRSVDAARKRFDAHDVRTQYALWLRVHQFGDSKFRVMCL